MVCLQDVHEGERQSGGRQRQGKTNATIHRTKVCQVNDTLMGEALVPSQVSSGAGPCGPAVKAN